MLCFKRVYLFGGLNGKANDADYVVAYQAKNGERIQVFELPCTSRQWYCVDGINYTTLREAKAAFARIYG